MDQSPCLFEVVNNAGTVDYDFGLLSDLTGGAALAPADWGRFTDIAFLSEAERTGRLLELGDYHTLCGNSVEAEESYSIALRACFDPALQLELGCLLAYRGSVTESPLCDHSFDKPPYEEWEPWTTVHDMAGWGSPAEDWQSTLQLAFRAYGNAWMGFRNMNGIDSAVRTIFSLDGMRVCSEELVDKETTTAVLVELRGELEAIEKGKVLSIGRRPADGGEMFPILTRAHERLRVSEAKMGVGSNERNRILRKAQREIPWLDEIPVAVQEYLVDGDYLAQVATAPGFEMKPPVNLYGQAIEAMIQKRLLPRIDDFLSSIAPKKKSELDELLTKHFGEKPRRKYTIGDWAKLFQSKELRNLVDDSGLGGSHVDQLATDLEIFAPARNASSHATAEATNLNAQAFDPERVVELRESAIRILKTIHDATFRQLKAGR